MSTLANAKVVLELLAHHGRDLTVTEVTEALDAPKSSVSRTLSLMAEHGFLTRDPVTKAYRPGDLIFAATYHFRGTHNTLAQLDAELLNLVEETGCTGYINMLDEASSLVVQMRAGSGRKLQVYTPVGTKGPAYATSAGRALLARKTDDAVLALVGDSLDPIGASPKTPAELLNWLATTRETGWAVSRGEYIENVAGVSAAVHDLSGKAYGISISIPTPDLEDGLIEHLGTLVRDAASRVGKLVGDPYWLTFQTR